jgi:hypothetical protein
MTSIGWTHAASVPLMALAVAVVFTINIQGSRKAFAGEPVWRASLRRFLKIMGLMAYSMAATHFLTLAAQARPGDVAFSMPARAFYQGAVLLLIAPIALYLGGAILLWIVGWIIGVDLEAKLFKALGMAKDEGEGEGEGEGEAQAGEGSAAS